MTARLYDVSHDGEKTKFSIEFPIGATGRLDLHNAKFVEGASTSWSLMAA